jgi:acyl carrier protein
MASRGARHYVARPGREFVGAYLRGLGERRAGPSAAAFATLSERVEPGLRVLVADGLGVDPEQLQTGTSLVDDLAADSLDVLDLVVRVEEQFDVVVPEREIGVVFTYGDLVATTTALVACRTCATDRARPAAGRVELRVGDREDGMPRFVRVFDPGPYDRQLLAADLLAARAGEPIEIRADASAGLERTLMRARLAGVDVRREGSGHPATPPAETAEVEEWTVGRLIARSLALVAALEAEREASVGGDGAAGEELARRRLATGECFDAFRAVVDAYLDILEDSWTTLDAAARELGRLRTVRDAVDARTLSAGATQDAYVAIADALLCYAHGLQSTIAWTRTRLPPRALRPRPSESAATPRDREPLHA